MNFRFTDTEEAFRHEVRDFLKKELPSDWEGGLGDEDIDTAELWAFAQQMRRKLAAKGWITLAWPKEYGGQGRSVMEELVFAEEMYYWGAPGRDRFGVEMLAPALMLHGTEEQKRKHLGGIARGEVVWCEGFSEPEAGSDLASLRTKAVEDGDDYIINGEKVWTTGAGHADAIFILARTDPNEPRHKGLSYFLVDMKTPGVQVRPLENLLGARSYNEVFFDDVRVPKENLVGEKNRGWYVAMSVLDFERGNIVFHSMPQKLVEDLVQYVNETKVDGRLLGKDPIIQEKLAEATTEIEVARMMVYNIASRRSHGLNITREAAAAKAFGSDMMQRVADVGMGILGLYAPLQPNSKWVRLQGRVQSLCLGSLGYKLAGGSSEIQRNIIANAGLGLPR